MEKSSKRYLISGGGTGGHIFPAVSIANALREHDPKCEILFVGANNRMEMERVPQAGYKIIGLPILGFNRQNLLKNIKVLINLVRSIVQVRKIVREFQPNVAIGVGGYASGAAMYAAAKMGIPVLLQEQNGFAGVTNKLLKDKAQTICVAYEGMEKFFPKEKIVLTGNPIRQNLCNGDKNEAQKFFFPHNASPKKTLLIIGGSLGARTINNAIMHHLQALADADIQVIWQTGKLYYEECKQAMQPFQDNHNILCTDFVSRMDLAYALADLVISRAGASSVSEICLLGKASILVPSPNVAEDHQTHNAMALVHKNATILIKDCDAEETLVSTALSKIQENETLETLGKNALLLAKPDATQQILNEILKIQR